MTPSRAHSSYHINSRWLSQVYMGEGQKPTVNWNSVCWLSWGFKSEGDKTEMDLENIWRDSNE